MTIRLVDLDLDGTVVDTRTLEIAAADAADRVAPPQHPAAVAPALRRCVLAERACA